MNNLLQIRIRRYKFLIVSLLLAVTLACVGVIPSARAKYEQARSADAFVDSIGVNVHLIYDDNVYVQKYSSVIKPRLQELGIRHIRDGSEVNQPRYYARLRDLAKIGIHSTLIEGIGRVTSEQAVAIAKQIGSAQEAVEGPNEFDNEKDAGNDWVPKLRSYVEQLHTAFKTDPATYNLPLIGPSFVDRNSSSLVGDLSQWVDYGNMHPYNFRNNPGQSNIDKEINNRSQPFKGESMIATEAGYFTASPENGSSISEVAQGKYLPRMFLEFFNRRVFRTFSYEFIDQRINPEDPQANFGILRNDGSPKPAFIALKNLITLLKDAGASFQLKSLDYRLTGDTSNVHHSLLQKRDGTFYLILWQEVPSFNSQTKVDISVPDRLVTLTLNTPIKQSDVYQPLTSITPLKLNPISQNIKLAIPDHLIVIRLVPALIK